jgi:hypothetical protein
MTVTGDSGGNPKRLKHGEQEQEEQEQEEEEEEEGVVVG